MLEQAVLIIHVLAAILIVVLILLQQGKGADAGASFGGGASQTVLGVQGGGNILTRWTAILVALFFITSLSLAYFAKQQSSINPNAIAGPEVEEVVSPEANQEIPSLDEESAADKPANDVPELPSESAPQ